MLKKKQDHLSNASEKVITDKVANQGSSVTVTVNKTAAESDLPSKLDDSNDKYSYEEQKRIEERPKIYLMLKCRAPKIEEEILIKILNPAIPTYTNLPDQRAGQIIVHNLKFDSFDFTGTFFNDEPKTFSFDYIPDSLKDTRRRFIIDRNDGNMKEVEINKEKELFKKMDSYVTNPDYRVRRHVDNEISTILNKYKCESAIFEDFEIEYKKQRIKEETKESAIRNESERRNSEAMKSRKF